jgi:tetratricopeptide (TPR) repeat protein
MQTHRVRLDSWKEISAELRVSERTARRYEILESLPVHRHMHDRRGSVYAWSDELESWKQSRSRAAAGGLTRDPLSESYSSGTNEATDQDRGGATENVANYWQAGAHPPLIGRDQERDLILRAVDAARSGRGSVVLIGGEPGIGKTHLVRVILAEAARRGCFGATGHCRDMEGAPPYAPFVEILEYCARSLPREDFRRALGDSAAEIARLVPGLRQAFADLPAPVDLPPEQQRRFLFNASREFVERWARLKPIMAVFEDIHWADEATLLLLTHLAQTVSAIPLLLVFTYRSADTDVCRPLARLLESCIRDKSVTRLALRRLGLPAVGAFLDQLSGQTAPAEVVSFVFDQTEGNPFFIEELFLDLQAEGKVFDGNGAWRNGLSSERLNVPQGVRLVIARALDRLREGTRNVLKVAAVVGRSFSVRSLEALERSHPNAVLHALDEAQRAQLIEPDWTARESRYRFVHELVRQTLAESLSLVRRRQIHALIVKGLEGLFAADLESQASALAYHSYQAGTAADPGRTIAYLVMAARLATSSAAYEDALAHIEKALALAHSERQANIAGLVASRAAVLRSLSRTDEAVEAYDHAIYLFNADERFAEAAEASHSLGHIHVWRGDPARACKVVHRAVQAVGMRAPLARYRLQLLNAVCLGVKGEMEAAFAALTEAGQLESSFPHISLNDIGYARMCEGHVRYFAAQIKTAAECASSAVAKFRATGNLWAEAETYEAMSDVSLGPSVDQRAGRLAESLTLAERVGHKNAAWVYRFMSAEMLMQRGDLEGAERTAREVHDFATAVSAHWAFLDYVLLAAVAHYRGKLGEAVQWSRRGLEVEPESYLSGQLSGCLFWTLAAQGDPEAGSALTGARAYLPVEGRILTIGSSSCLSLVIEGLAVAGRRQEAAALESEAEWVVATGPLFLYTRHLFRTSAGIAAACARHWARAEEHHQAAIHIADSTGCRVAQPVARYWYADMLYSRDMAGDRQRAREFLSEALSLYDAMGMVWHAGCAAKRLSKNL